VNPFPSYLEMKQPLPLWVWHVLRAGMMAGAFALVAMLFIRPRDGLIAWWLFVLPCIPLLLMLAPGIWRNLCPLAALNQYPRLFGFTRGKTVPARLLRSAFLIQVTLYFALISTRAPVFDHNGPAVGVLMMVALGAAFLGGVVFKGKSGWCGTFCPIMPVQRLYGQTPAVVVPNSHCSTCVGCTPNCLDFNPRLAVVADVQEGTAERVGQLKFFAGAFPGFVVAFFTLPNSIVGDPANLAVSVPRFYLLTAAYMLVSLGIFYFLDTFLPVSPLVLMAAFGAIGLNLHNILRFPTSFHFEKPAWMLGVEYTVVAAATAQFVVRTYLKERQVARLFGPGGGDGVTVRPGGGYEAAGASSNGGSHEVSFEPDGSRVIVCSGTTLLDVVERAGLPIEVGCRMGVCGADPVRVLDGSEHLSPPTPGEQSTLARLGLADGCRMACSARLSGDVRVSLDVSQAETLRSTRVKVEYDRTVANVVVIGNGIAGVTAADHVRRRHPECAIDLIGEESHSTYNRMGITRLVYGSSAMIGLRLLPDDWYERNRVTCWLNTVVHEIDRAARRVTLGTGEILPYSRLILTTGATSYVPPVEGMDRQGVFMLRTADDAIGIRSYAQRRRCGRAAVVGGGLLGLEAAFALHKLGLRVTVLHRSEQLLGGQLDARGSELLERYFLGLGIGVVLGATPVAVEEEDGRRALRLGDGTRLDADLIVVCTGIRPTVDLAEAAGLDVEAGVLVDEHMRSSDPLVYAAGDVAQFEGQVYGLWPVAAAQAEVAAANAVGDVRSYKPQPPVTILKGVGLPVTSIGEINGAAGTEHLSWHSGDDEIRYWKVVVRDDRLVGAVILGRWPETPSVVDAVAANADVSGTLDALRAGDLSALTRS
jgi:NADPH-dependent 2,4-dienoyl-CoA reductase/sulfur reductase-like enzyme/ferredoxin